MSSFFGVGVNPFTTQVGQRIEQATDGSLASENWALNIEICDIINETEDGHKDAVKALRKRLQQNVGKNHTVVMYTLTVLETCVKNCGKRFHVLVCNKEFIQELVKLIGPKYDPPTSVQEKVLSLIQSWADAFKNQPEMNGVVQVYQDLKNKGIEFPPTDLDAMAPIHTPQRSIPDGSDIPVGVPALVAQQEGTLGVSAPPHMTHQQQPNAVPVPRAAAQQLAPDQMAKLRKELDVVTGNMNVLNEMLTELTPGKEHPSDIQLLKELYSTCKVMQQRLVELISKLANDEVTAELLRINDLLNNLFLRYSRFEKNCGMGSRESVPTTNGVADGEKGAESLIDLSDEGLNSQLSALSMGATASSQLASMSSVSAQQGAAAVNSRLRKDDTEFDMFAQSRNATYESSKAGGSTYEANLKPDQISGGLGAATAARNSIQATPSTQQPDSLIAMHKESDFDEMAAWLGEEESAPQESLTSSEFDRFLAERAAAADGGATPSRTPAPPTSTSTASPRHRKSQKEEEASLFAM
ncbi:TOM1-like protein 2 isoform X3 [Nilaparvata lugens]|uniref:TOM1-like protein 2 isoform X3 n=1 Tax=Nilaparvata lugens TaxID=108931 RepID=UPI00193EB1D3|nr:TOM1-like protein 2 isoform X3 [Nilaparvata lugens]